MPFRPLLSVIASSVNCLPKKNGKDLTMREYSNILLWLIWPCPSRMDLFFWYGYAFGSPVARVQGIGWIQELVARLTHAPIAVHNTSTNSTLDDNPITFPLDNSLYVDATHEVVILSSKWLILVRFGMKSDMLSLLLSHHRTWFDQLCWTRTIAVYTYP